MAGGGKGANRGGGWRFRGLVWAFLAGDGGDLLRGGPGAARGQPGLPRPAGACAAPGDMMIDCCDVGSHVVSESVEGGWLMPGT